MPPEAHRDEREDDARPVRVTGACAGAPGGGRW
ncbi:hypothetical protein GA0115242_112750, partial [Streptomyces sp. SolWspMP-5a-2]